jgi:hypothetical protein
MDEFGEDEEVCRELLRSEKPYKDKGHMIYHESWATFENERRHY